MLLLLPALVLWFMYQVLPVGRTLLLSMRSGGSDAAGGFVGLENFTRIPGGLILSMLVNVLLGALVAGVGVLVGLGVGSLVRRAALSTQRVALAALGLALVTYAPVSLVIALYFDPYWEKLSAVAMFVAILPIPVLIGGIAGAITRSGRLIAMIAVVVALGGGAWATQSDLSILIAAPEAPSSFIYQHGIVFFDPGLGGAASTVLGVLVGALGVGAGLVLLLSRPRFDLAGDRRPAGLVGTAASLAAQPGHRPVDSAYPDYTARAGGAFDGATMSPGPYGHTGTGSGGRNPLAIIAAIVVLVVLVLMSLPWLIHLWQTSELQDPAGAARATWSTVGRNALEVVITVLVTGAAALGLGYLRPFGRHSLRMLVLFSPWLFVGLVPLMTGLMFRLDGPYLDAPFFGLTAQPLSVPLLFVGAYLGDALRTARDGGHRARTGPLLGLALLAVGVLALTRGQQVVWNLVFRFQDPANALSYFMQAVMATFGGTKPMGILTPVPLLLVGGAVLAFAAALVPGARLVPAAELADRAPVPGGSVPAGAPGTPWTGQYPQQPTHPQYPQQPTHPQHAWGAQYPAQPGWPEHSAQDPRLPEQAPPFDQRHQGPDPQSWQRPQD